MRNFTQRGGDKPRIPPDLVLQVDQIGLDLFERGNLSLDHFAECWRLYLLDAQLLSRFFPSSCSTIVIVIATFQWGTCRGAASERQVLWFLARAWPADRTGLTTITQFIWISPTQTRYPPKTALHRVPAADVHV